MASSIALHIPVLGEQLGDVIAISTDQREPPRPSPVRDEPSEAEKRRLEQAYQRGLSEGRDKAEEVFVEEKAQLAIEHEQALADLRAQLENTAGETLAIQVQAAFGVLEERLGNVIGEILQPFVLESVRNDILQTFSEALQKLIQSKEDCVVTVRGPQALLEGLKDGLGGLVDAVRLEPGEGCELTASLGATVIETQLEAWRAQIEDKKEQA